MRIVIISGMLQSDHGDFMNQLQPYPEDPWDWYIYLTFTMDLSHM